MWTAQKRLCHIRKRGKCYVNHTNALKIMNITTFLHSENETEYKLTTKYSKGFRVFIRE